MVVAAVALAAVVGFSACSSSTSKSGADGKTSCAGKRVGLVEIVPPSVSPTVAAMETSVRDTATLLGWELNVLAADGTPAQMNAVIQNQVTAGVSAIINIGIQPGVTTAAMQAAKDANIPIVGVGTIFDDPQKLLAATYGPNDVELSTALANQMKKDYPNGAQALSLNSAAIPSVVQRKVTLEKETKDAKITVAKQHETDLANGIKDTENAVATNLRANPNINMVWALQDFELATAVSTITSQQLQPAGVYGYFPPPDAFTAMRAWQPGQAPIVAVDSPTKYSPWYAYDSLVNKLCLNKSDWIVKQSEKPLPLKTFVAGSTNDANKVPAGDSYDWGTDFPSYFTNKWKGEDVKLNG